MKKILLTLIIIASVTIAKAQTEKGSMYLGGSVGFNSSALNQPGLQTRNLREFNIAPTIGFFVANNWSIAVTPTYRYSKDSVTAASGFGGSPLTSVNKQKYLGGSIDVRYYVNITPQFAFFPQLSGGYYGLVGDKTKSGNMTAVGISPNFAYFPTKKWAINLGFGALQYRYESLTYKATSTTAEVKNTSKNFDFAANSGINLGVNYFFGK